MRIECPSCRQVLMAPDDAVGRRASCKVCKTTFVIGQPSPVAAAPKVVPVIQETSRRPAGLPCPHCNAALAPQTIICHQCGFNLQTGRLPDAETLEAEDAEDDSPGMGVRLIVTISEWMPGLFRPKIVILSIVTSLIGFAIMVFCLAIVALGSLIEACFVGGLGLIIYGQALAMLLVGDTSLLPELLSELDGKRWLLFVTLLFAPFVILFLALRHHFPH